jgi:predicted AlkP superfamily pyrophosphatase or phosphodiesterase
MTRTAVINVVGLTSRLIGAATPQIEAFLRRGSMTRVCPAFPAVTCTAQSNYLTGKPPSGHGIVANGWYDRQLAEVHFWKQSNHLVGAPKLWEELRKSSPGFTCAKLFWWYNMYSSADYSITPRPMYPADGRKVFDIYTAPFSIRPAIKQELGEFPFPCFWGPAAGRQSPQGAPDAVSRWIAGSARWIEKQYQPTLSLVYLPHLDYNLQRIGPQHPEIKDDLQRIDRIVGDLIGFFESRAVQVLLLSEYGITPVDQPIHLNRVFRSKGWLTIKEELGLELLDYGASKVFAVADHQVAHVYLNEPALKPQVRALLEQQEGVAFVLDPTGPPPADPAARIDPGSIHHPRSGDLIAVSKENAWFTYYYWNDDRVAPDFARCVDIHRKPGYDPVELFLDPAIPLVKLKILRRLLQKKLGFRMLMNVIPLDATLVKGSHGCRPRDPADYPLVISARKDLLPAAQVDSTEVYGILAAHLR